MNIQFLPTNKPYQTHYLRHCNTEKHWHQKPVGHSSLLVRCWFLFYICILSGKNRNKLARERLPPNLRFGTHFQPRNLENDWTEAYRLRRFVVKVWWLQRSRLQLNKLVLRIFRSPERIPSWWYRFLSMVSLLCFERRLVRWGPRKRRERWFFRVLVQTWNVNLIRESDNLKKLEFIWSHFRSFQGQNGHFRVKNSRFRVKIAHFRSIMSRLAHFCENTL